MFLDSNYDYSRLLNVLYKLGLERHKLHSVFRSQLPWGEQYNIICGGVAVEPLVFSGLQSFPGKIDPDKVVQLAVEAYKMGLDDYQYSSSGM